MRCDRTSPCHDMAYSDAETKRKALERGADDLLTKPIDFLALGDKIDTRVG
jgi:DNA-binding response OmpR family regulator